MRNLTSPWLHRSALLGAVSIATVAAGCGDGGGSSSGGSGGTTTTTSTGGTTGGTGGVTGGTGGVTGGTGGTGGVTGGTGGTGGATGGTGGVTGGTGGATGGTGGTGGTTTVTSLCPTTAPAETRGSAIALSPKDDVLVAVNRDVGTVSVFHIDYPNNTPALTKIAELAVGAADSEPWQVAMDACGTRAYVVLRKEQKVVELLDIDTATPVVGASVAVGSEPTGIAITPNNTKVFATNWVDGTATAIDALTMAVTSTIDLNAPLAATGLLGPAVMGNARPGLAHPRSIAITNNGDASDADESVYVTEYFAQRTAPDALAGVTIDTNWKGLIYKFGVENATVTTLDLPPVMDTGFKDHNNETTGCFPNQVSSITLNNGFAYVTSICASPKGPLGVFAGKNAGGACTVPTQAADCGAVGGVCNANTLVCNPNPTDVKTTTHPAVSIVKLADGTGATTNIDQNFNALNNAFPRRMPHLPTDIDFKNNFAYLSGMGADAVFRMTTANGAITAVGSATNNFINLRVDANDKVIRTPIGVAVAHTAGLFAFSLSDGKREVQAIDLGTQSLLSGTASSMLPAAGTQPDKVLRGKRFFNTGLARWSLAGEAWGSCAACHTDGLTDNVTWYFARGPRQSVSLDGSFNSMDGADQRIFNWTGIFDEVADFEGNVRGVSGGVGAIVTANSSPPVNADRVDTATPDLPAGTPPQQGLQGSSADTADIAGVGPHVHGILADWAEVTEYIKSIRSPRRASNLVAADVAAGKTLFDSNQGNCVGCHSGPKWTISKVFWPVGDAANAKTASMAATSLGVKDWFTGQNLNGFPAALFPVLAPDATNARMRFGAPPGAEQIQCILRPVGTIAAGASTAGVSPAAVGVFELRQDMVTKGQGAADTGRGFNPPSLLGVQTGAPYFHAGNARTLEEVFADDANVSFKGHFQSPVAQIFAPNATQVKQLVAYLMSIDEQQTSFAIPAKGAKGGDLCFYP